MSISPGDAARLLTADEVAKVLRVQPRLVYDLARRGELPKVQVGKYIRFRATAIEGWVASQETGR